VANQFIPSFHYVPAEDKISNEWFAQANNYSWYNASNKSLLWDKNVKDILEYASGQFDLSPYKKMYKSMQKKDRIPNVVNTQNSNNEIDWHCLALITNKLNAGVALINKIPIEVTVKALDPLAQKKKEEDITFLKNKPEIEKELEPIAAAFNIPPIDLGTTKNSSIDYGNNPYGLDLNEPDELNVFINLLYSLKVEASFETVLQIFWNLSKANQVKLLEIRDHFMFGVSANQPIQNGLTELPTLKYLYPGDVIVPRSDYPDFRDIPHGYVRYRMTPDEFMSMFPDEIVSKEQMDEFLNAKGTGYCACNRISRIDKGHWDQQKINIVYCAIKSIDTIGIMSNPKKSPYSYLTSDKEEIKKSSGKIIAQNTYCAFWMEKTKHYFGKERLGWAFREKGLESYQTMPFNIYKSQERSAVELSIGENKIAQEAYIKMQHFIRKALPPGRKIDLRFVRNVIEGLKEEDNQFTMDELLRLIFEENIVITDTQGFDGKNDGQFSAVEDLAGGVRVELGGFVSVIENAKRNIGQFMGINDQVTGQGVNPEGLVGIQKLLVNASINSISYINEAIQDQIQKIFNNWSFIVKDAVEAGGKPKQAIVNLIGSQKTNIIDGIEDFPSHQMSVQISMTQREEERAKFERDMEVLKQNGVIDIVDEYMLSEITNPKDQMALLAVKVKQFRKRQDQIRKEQFAQQQQLMQQQGQNAVASKQAEAEGDRNTVYAKGEVQARITQLAKQLDMSELQVEGLLKRQLQTERNDAQLQKTLQSLETKANLQTQNAFS
jgi:hypothetical protein